MTTIVTRAGKGAPLTNAEMDLNLTNLNADKLEKSSNLSDLTNAATARANLGLTIGTHVQAYSAELASLAGLAATGFVVRDNTGSHVIRALAFAAGITITNPTGVAANPTIGPANDLAAIEALASTGFAVRTANETWAQRTLTGTAGRLSITNTQGILGDPVFDIDANYVGQNTITTVGTVATGTWAATITTADASVTLTNGTRNAKFSAASITAGQTRTFTLPDVSDTIATLAATQTLTNKTLSSPTLTGTMVVPNGSKAFAPTGYASSGLTFTNGDFALFTGSSSETAQFQLNASAVSLTLSGGAHQILSLSDSAGDAFHLRYHNSAELQVRRNATVLWWWDTSGHLLASGKNIGSITNRPSTYHASTGYRAYANFVDASNYANATLLGTELSYQEVGAPVATDFRIMVNTASRKLIFGTDGTDRWLVNGSGHFLTNVDNTLDFGSAGANRARSIYWGTQALAPDGTLANPSYSFASDTNTGIRWVSADVMAFITGGATRITIDGSGHLLFGTDNAADIGAAAATRPRRVYAATDFVGPIGATTPTTAVFTTMTASGLVSANGNSVNATPGFTSINAENGFYFSSSFCWSSTFSGPTDWAN